MVCDVEYRDGAVAEAKGFQPPLGIGLQRLRSRIPKTGSNFIDDSVFTVAPRIYYRCVDDSDGSISEALLGGGRRFLKAVGICPS